MIKEEAIARAELLANETRRVYCVVQFGEGGVTYGVVTPDFFVKELAHIGCIKTDTINPSPLVDYQKSGKYTQAQKRINNLFNQLRVNPEKETI